jgi:hypothetical protein
MGTTNSVQTTNMNVSDSLITLNKGGAVSSAGGAGIEIEENGTSTGYIKVSATRESIQC